MRKQTAQQFAAYAREQIGAAEQILARHRTVDDRFCACGRWLPCTIAGAAIRTRDHFTGQLSLVETTRKLPTGAPSAPAQLSWWRRTFGGGRS